MDTETGSEMITDPLLMQRICYEILREPNKTTGSPTSKRKFSAIIGHENGRYEEEVNKNKTRHFRPGMREWRDFKSGSTRD